MGGLFVISTWAGHQSVTPRFNVESPQTTAKQAPGQDTSL